MAPAAEASAAIHNTGTTSISSLLEGAGISARSARTSCTHFVCICSSAHFLRDTQHARTRARIRRDFLCRRAHFAADALQARLRGIGNQRQPREHRVDGRVALDELLDDAVFERMKTD